MCRPLISTSQSFIVNMYNIYIICVFFVFVEMIIADPASEQLEDYLKTHRASSILRTTWGAPVPDFQSSLTVNPYGTLLLQDNIFLDTMAHFSREIQKERVVHPRGSDAFGVFKVTKDITNLTRAKLFESVGKETKIAVRFSKAISERGTPETVRDVHGFAIKFYTEEGTWDLTATSAPVFFVRDPILVPSITHIFHRNPVTNIRLDSNMVWDFVLHRPDTTTSALFFFSDFGTPDGYRHFRAFGLNTYKFANANHEAVYVRFHLLPDQGIKNLNPEQAMNLSVFDPDYYTRDLYNAIAEGNYPSFTLLIQVMTFDQAEQFPKNPFDATIQWSEEDFPLTEVGRLTLNRNPTNYYSDVEQIAFNPAHMVPGIEASPDITLQSRIFVYGDTQRYRLGVNYLQLPVNCPFAGGNVNTYMKEGPAVFYSQGSAPNYYPNSFNGPEVDPSAAISPFHLSGDVKRYNSTTDDFDEAIKFWKSLSGEGQQHLVDQLVGSLKPAAKFIQDRVVKMFKNVDDNLAKMVLKALQ